MKNVFISILLFISLQVYSQGAWNIEYFPIDSIDNKWIGEDVRLDFKSGSLDTLKGKVEFLEIRSLLSTKETVFISSNNKIYHFIENWKLYPDHGVLRDQKLYTFDSNLIVEEIIMESILDTVILVTMKFYKQNDL